MRTVLLLVIVLAVPAHVPAAAAGVSYDHAFDDPEGDVVVRVGAQPPEPAARPEIDVVRLASWLDGGTVVHEVGFAAPLEEGASVTVHTQVGRTDESHALALTYAHEASLPEEDRTTGMVTRPDGPPVGVPVNVTVAGAVVRFAVAEAALPAGFLCFDPAVVVGRKVPGEGGTWSFEDAVTHEGHTGCLGLDVRGVAGFGAAVAVSAAVAAARTRRTRR